LTVQRVLINVSRLKVKNFPEERSRETDFSTEQSEAGQASRLSQADVHARGPTDIEPTAEQGTQARLRLMVDDPGRPLVWRSLRLRDDFDRIYAEGVKRVGHLVVLYLLPAPDLAHAVVASRRLGGAVKRNRAKRLLREALRTSGLGDRSGVEAVRTKFFHDRDAGQDDLARAQGLWVVAVARRRILTAKTPAVISDIEQLLR
jgi:hypothetical protein